MKMTIKPCLGIPVVYDDKMRSISDSRGLWFWKKIVIGQQFVGFPPREQAAILMHEAGHCKMWHLEKRLLRLWLVLWRPTELIRYCQEQEFEADRFAAAAGYGQDLARAFLRVKAAEDPLHPPMRERVLRLQGAP